jgi:hypothetical protein
MMAAVQIRNRALAWWQELLIVWLLYSMFVLAGNAVVARVFGWAGMRRRRTGLLCAWSGSARCDRDL